MTNRYSSTNYDYLGETSANQTGLTALNGISGRMKTTFGTTEEVLSMSYDPNVGNVLTSKSTIMMSRRLFAVKCDPSCLTCDGPLPSDCTKSNTKFAILCPAGYTLSNGKCVRIQWFTLKLYVLKFDMSDCHCFCEVSWLVQINRQADTYVIGYQLQGDQTH